MSQFILEQNGPIIAERMRQARIPGRFTVVACHYGNHDTAWPVNTLRQAFRILGSVCSSTRGKLHKRDVFAACVVTPDARVMNWQECKTALRRIA